MSTSGTKPRTCPECGRAVPESSPHGLCRACLAKTAVEGMGDESQPSPDLQVSRFIGDYELLQEIGRGGMGVVWRARERKQNRIVALKLLLAGPYAAEEARERFRREARMVAALRHPNIVAVHHVGEHEGHPFYSMDFIEGTNLSQRLRDSLPPARQAAEWIVILAEAVAHAHAQGIVHRDIKPANILLDVLDVPHLTDFGLAKPFTDPNELTLTGQAIGSVSYMAPEQATGRNREVTIATDVYALGAVLFHLLTGRPPFLADTPAATIRQVTESEPVSPRELNPSAPLPLATICLKCLEKDPARRYESAQALAEELKRFLKGERIRARPASAIAKTGRWVRRNPLVTTLGTLLAVSLLVGMGIALWQLRRAERFLADSRAANSQLAQTLARRDQQAAQEQFMRDRPLLGMAALAQLVRDDPANTLAAARLFNALATVPLPWPVLPPLVHESSVEQGDMTLDGRFIVTASQKGLVHVWSATSAVQCATIPHDTVRGRFALSPNGKYVATLRIQGGASVWRLPEAKLAYELRTDDFAPGNITCLDFKADGSLLATAGTDGAVQLWNVAAGRPVRSFSVNEPVQYAEFQATGERLLALGTTNCFVWDISPKADGRAGEPYLSIQSTERFHSAAFSPKGDRLVTVASNRVELWDVGRRERLRLIEHRAQVTAAALNTDGTTLALAGEDRRIWLYPANDRLRPVSFGYRPRVHALRFRPGDSLLLTASDNATASLWRTGERQELIEPIRHKHAISEVSFSPDRSKVLTVSADQTARLWFVLRTSVRTTALPEQDKATLMEWSPSGEYIAAASEDGAIRVYRASDTHLLAATLPEHGKMRSLAFDASNRHLASLDERGQLTVFEAATGSLLARPLAQGAVVSQVQWGPRSLLAATTETNAWLWEIRGAQAVQRACVPFPNARLLGFSDNGERWVIAGGKFAQALEARTGQPVGKMLAHSGAMGCVQFSPDGRLIATTCQGGRVQVWEAATGNPRSLPITPGNDVTAIAFSPNSQHLLLGAADGTVSLWEVQSGNLHRTLDRGQRPVQSLDFSRDGDSVLIAGGDGLVRLLHADSALPVMNPFTVKPNSTVHARFSQDNRRILARGQDTPLLASIKSPLVAVPKTDLLIAMTELVLGQRLTEMGGWQDLTSEEFFARQRLLTAANWRLGPDAQVRSYR